MTYVLIVVLALGSFRGGLGIVQTEFTSFEACEAARKHVIKAADDAGGVRLRSHGCHKK